MKNKMQSHTYRLIRSFLLLAVILSVFISASSVTRADEGGAPSDLASGTARVFDRASLFSEEEAEMLTESIASLRDEMDMDVVIVTTDDADGKTAREYAEDFYIDGNFGTGKEYSGVLYLIDMDNREIYLAHFGQMNRYLTDKRWNAILDDAYEKVADGDFAASARVFLSGVEKYYKAGIPDNQYNYNEETGKISVYRSIRWYEVLLAFAVAAAAAAGSCIAVKNGYSMKKEVRQSNNYLMSYRADCMFQYDESSDHLLSKNVTHIILPRNNGSGSGHSGGSRSSSGGRSTIHTNSGRSVGGGGRKF